MGWIFLQRAGQLHKHLADKSHWNKHTVQVYESITECMTTMWKKSHVYLHFRLHYEISECNKHSTEEICKWEILSCVSSKNNNQVQQGQKLAHISVENF